MYAEKIRDRLGMTEALEYYGIRLNSRGFACCPFHQEKTASFHVMPDNTTAHCFGCGETVDVVGFVMKYFSLDFRQAVSKIDYDFRLGLDIGRPLTLREQYAAKKAARQREAEKRQREKLLSDARAEYELALDKWTFFDRCRELPPDDPLHAEALRRIDAAAYRLDCAELKLYELTHDYMN